MRTVAETLELVLSQVPKLAYELVPIRDARGTSSNASFGT